MWAAYQPARVTQTHPHVHTPSHWYKSTYIKRHSYTRHTPHAHMRICIMRFSTVCVWAWMYLWHLPIWWGHRGRIQSWSTSTWANPRSHADCRYRATSCIPAFELHSAPALSYTLNSPCFANTGAFLCLPLESLYLSMTMFGCVLLYKGILFSLPSSVIPVTCDEVWKVSFSLLPLAAGSMNHPLLKLVLRRYTFQMNNWITQQLPVCGHTN